MSKLQYYLFLLGSCILLVVSCQRETYYQSLAGEWEVSLDRMIVPGAIDKQQVCTITLPTTTDELEQVLIAFRDHADELQEVSDT
jgi:hypothetical protein